MFGLLKILAVKVGTSVVGFLAMSAHQPCSPACLVCLVSAVRGCHKNALGRGSASGKHIKLEHSTYL